MAKQSWISTTNRTVGINPVKTIGDFFSKVAEGLGGLTFGTSSSKSNSGDAEYTDVYTVPNQANIDSTIQDKVNAYADILNKHGLNPGGSNSSSYSSGGGYTAPNRIDIQPMIDAFTNAANARKNTLQTTANQQRSELLNSIKRFQEQTARSQEIQRDAFNASRADLEEAAFQADRANRISAAARGIGGSGLQQLSQLQTLMEQNSSISDLAKENTNVQTELAKNLAEYEEDTNTSIQNLMANLANSLSEIDADLGNRIADLRYTEDTRYETARQNALENAMNRAESQRASEQAARNSYAQALADYENNLKSSYDLGADTLTLRARDFANSISNITDTDTISALLDTAKADMYQLAYDNEIPSDIYSQAIRDLQNYYTIRLDEINRPKNKNTSWLGIEAPTNDPDALAKKLQQAGFNVSY